MKKQMTREEAIAFHGERKWEPMDIKERARFQLQQDCLCMPFSVFHQATEALLGRPVWTHEFADRKRLLAESVGK